MASKEMHSPLLLNDTISLNVEKTQDAAVRQISVSPYSQSSRELLPAVVSKEGTLTSSIANLAGTILGSTSLALPFTAYNLGLAGYAIGLITFGIMAEASIRQLAASMRLSGLNTFGDIGQAAFGRVARVTVLVAVVVQQLAADIAFLQIIGDVLKDAINGLPAPLDSPALWQVALVAAIILPLCMLPKINSLRFSSLAAVLFVVSFVVVVAIDGFSQFSKTHVSPGPGASHPIGIDWDAMHIWPASWTGALTSAPVIFFCFVCHMNVPAVVNELRNATPERISIVSKGSVGLAGLLYLTVGTMGYIAFGNMFIKDDIISSYGNMQHGDDPHGHSIYVPASAVQTVQVFIAIALTFSFPIVTYELRHCFIALVAPKRVHEWSTNAAVNVGIVTVALLVAIFVPNISTVLGIAGASSSCLVVFVLPAAFYARLQELPWKRDKLKLFAICQATIGAIMIPIAVGSQIYGLVTA